MVQFAKVGEIDTLKEQYSADVIVKGKWREPALDGQTHTVSLRIFLKITLTFHLFVLPSHTMFILFV